MNTYIYMLRHGEVDNPNRIFYGRLPHFGLTDRGKQEIEQSAQFLKDKNIDILFSSPMLRARQTAAIIQQELNLPDVQIARSIIELRTSYEGSLMNLLDGVQSQVYLEPKAKTDETISQIASRMESFVWRVIKTYPEKTIAFVTHGDPAMCLQAKIENWPLEFPSIRKGEYIQHGEVWKITNESETNLHLDKVYQPGLSSK